MSFGAEGTVSRCELALQQAAVGVPTYDFVGGLGGDDISEAQVRGMYAMLAQAAEGADDLPRVSFLGIDSPADCHPERSAQRGAEGSRAESAEALSERGRSHGRQCQEHH